MNYLHFIQKKAIFSKFLVILFALSIVIPVTSIQAASTNLIKNPSFEQGSVNTYWDLWNNVPRTRTYSMYRSYEVPFASGSYSAAIEATGPISNLYDAGIVTNAQNPFTVTAGKTYYFSLYTKATRPTTVSVYLQKADNYEALAPSQEIVVSSDWKKQVLVFQPTKTASAALGIAFGNLKEDNTFFLDNLDLSENTLSFSNQDVSGFIGQVKTVTITGGNNLNTNDVKIELPYFNSETNSVERKKFSPTSINNRVATFTIPTQTFSGLGKVYFLNTELGSFNYNVLTKISSVSPDPVSSDEDVVIYGSGFNPDLSKNTVVVKSIAVNGTISETILRPHTIDSTLSQLVVKLPVGLANDKLGVRTSFINIAGVTVENKSNLIAYTVKPVIYGATWSLRGHEQVGDKLTINGKGIVYRPTVYFYNENNEFISKKAATVKRIVTGSENFEEIEVITPVTLNKVKITVKVGPNESDKTDALLYNAKPIITSIKANHKRALGGNSSIAAAKVGETIRLDGKGFKTSAPVIVEFWSIHGGVLTTTAEVTHIDPKGAWVDVVVPAGVQNGEINVKINDQKSNNISLEIIPTIISSQPIEPVPGSELSITTQGVSLDLSQTNVYFKLSNNEEVAVSPSQLTLSGDNVIITVLAPRAIPNQGATLRIQSGNWYNDETYRIVAAPHIDEATINSNKVLTIKGYGFSSVPKNNKITFKYSDGTIVTPKFKILSVTPTSEGQEIKVNILDDYYYGYIFITVGETRSNEVNVGPAVISHLERRVQFVQANNKVMGVLYISGRNFGLRGDVKVGDTWATTHYRSNTFIIAVVEKENLYKNPVIITKK